jgi:hypothetical protein
MFGSELDDLINVGRLQYPVYHAYPCNLRLKACLYGELYILVTDDAPTLSVSTESLNIALITSRWIEQDLTGACGYDT